MSILKRKWSIGALAFAAVLLFAGNASAVIITYHDSSVPVYGTLTMAYTYNANGRVSSYAGAPYAGIGIGNTTITSYSGNTQAGGRGGAASYYMHGLSDVAYYDHHFGIALGQPPTYAPDVWSVWASSTSPSESYSSQVGFYSRKTYFDGYPTSWDIYVLPGSGETAGTPVTVTITVDIAGTIASSGNATATASWNVDTSLGSIIAGSTSTNGDFADTATLEFTTTLGSYFTLYTQELVNVYGTGIGSGTATISNFRIGFDAEVVEAAIPEPATFAVWSVFGAMGLVVGGWRRKCAS